MLYGRESGRDAWAGLTDPPHLAASDPRPRVSATLFNCVCAVGSQPVRRPVLMTTAAAVPHREGRYAVMSHKLKADRSHNERRCLLVYGRRDRWLH
jgi:hypothetical protein